ncbi:hypothetical protein Droror1_Dr00020654, partial [Drosera rotundifolia]
MVAHPLLDVFYWITSLPSRYVPCSVYVGLVSPLLLDPGPSSCPSQCTLDIASSVPHQGPCSVPFSGACSVSPARYLTQVPARYPSQVPARYRLLGTSPRSLLGTLLRCLFGIACSVPRGSRSVPFSDALLGIACSVPHRVPARYPSRVHCSISLA